MADIIQLLPDAVANQIAAGEVIQRPASVVKELVENAIDAGATNIKIIIKDAGSSLIQIIDNGCGMSETDARMSFERHATSKIKSAKDLFSIRTMGFRGEAMASIAAIAHVDMRTRQANDELGTHLVIEGAEVKVSEACQTAPGTIISVKNLFYNVPARRKFLKSQATELRKIITEFQYLALANPDIAFSLAHNGKDLFRLIAGNLRNRVVNIFGDATNKKLIPVNEQTDIVKIEGFVGKPEFAKKRRGEQLFFVNQRFIKSPYLNHAILSSYEGLLQADSFPLYILFLEIDPENIDINVHPTKQEIKFDDERLIYNYLKVAVRHALGQYSITPSLDFESERSMSNLGSYPEPKAQRPEQADTPQEIPTTGRPRLPQKETTRQANNLKNWQELYKGLDETGTADTENDEPLTIQSKWSDEPTLDDEKGTFSKEVKNPYQVHRQYIVSQIKTGVMVIHQNHASERILYEKYSALLEKKQSLVQKELFPKTLELSPNDANILKLILADVNSLGFDIQEFGQNAFIVQGIPSDLPKGADPQKIIEALLEQFDTNIELQSNINRSIAQSIAKTTAIKTGQKLEPEEMQTLIDQLFACEVPFKSPSGKKCFITFDLSDLNKKFDSI